MNRGRGVTIAAWIVLLVTFVCGVAAIVVSVDAAFRSERARADAAQRQLASDRRLQHCIVALLLIPPEQRVRLSAGEVERLCPPVDEFVVPPTTTTTSTSTTSTTSPTSTSRAAARRTTVTTRPARPPRTTTTTRPPTTTTTQPCVTRLSDWCVIAGPPPRDV